MHSRRILFIAACVALALLAVITAATALTVTSIAPNTATRGQTVTATVTGTGINTGAQVKLVGSGMTIYASSETRLSTTQLRCTVAVPSSAYIGYYTLYVQNPGGAWIAKTGAFRVNAPATGLAVTAIAPNAAPRGSSLTAVVVGTGFIPGMKVKLTGGTSVIYGTSATTIGTTAVRCALTIPSTAYVGYYTVAVQKPGSTAWVSKAGIFRVTTTPGAPVTITQLSPMSAARGQTRTIGVYGSGFKSGAQVKLTRGSTTISASGESTVSASQISCTVTVPSTAPYGAYTAWVQNPGGSWVSKSNAFQVTTYVPTPTPPKVTITSITPSSAVRPATGCNPMWVVTVSGAGFKPGAQFWISGNGFALYAQSEGTNAAGTAITGTWAICNGASLGAYTVYVQNPGEAAVSKANAFTVTG